ncbi:MAG: hypothetical protein C5S43_00040 [Candidatus Methanocomedens sp.]|nr:MAG: hypothetical protein C5S43_00040 [ANME-2 cluster archaeon]
MQQSRSIRHRQGSQICEIETSAQRSAHYGFEYHGYSRAGYQHGGFAALGLAVICGGQVCALQFRVPAALCPDMVQPLFIRIINIKFHILEFINNYCDPDSGKGREFFGNTDKAVPVIACVLCPVFLVPVKKLSDKFFCQVHCLMVRGIFQQSLRSDMFLQIQ